MSRFSRERTRITSKKKVGAWCAHNATRGCRWAYVGEGGVAEDFEERRRRNGFGNTYIRHDGGNWLDSRGSWPRFPQRNRSAQWTATRQLVRAVSGQALKGTGILLSFRNPCRYCLSTFVFLQIIPLQSWLSSCHGQGEDKSPRVLQRLEAKAEDLGMLLPSA
jgi:hypothetical protein